jgi:opacity protein-like surface antigen
MHKSVLLILACIVLVSPAAIAQSQSSTTTKTKTTTTSSSDKDFSGVFPGAEFFVGYTNLQSEGLPNRNTPGWVFDNSFFRDRSTQHGANVELSGFATNWFSLTGDVSFARQSESASNGSSGTNTTRTDTYYFMGGPSWKIRKTFHLEPFARVMAGAAHTHYRASTSTPSGGGTTTNAFTAGSTDFAASVGGGFDIRLADHAKLRILQVDYAPVFLRDRTVNVLGAAGAITPTDLEGQRQDNFRFSFGFVF